VLKARSGHVACRKRILNGKGEASLKEAGEVGCRRIPSTTTTICMNGRNQVSDTRHRLDHREIDRKERAGQREGLWRRGARRKVELPQARGGCCSNAGTTSGSLVLIL
jgi:hypothetical protein